MLSKHSLLFVMAGVILTLAMVSAKGLPNQAEKVKAQPCCYPDAFETNYGEMVGYHDNQMNISGSRTFMSVISYDATAMKVARNIQINDVPGIKNLKLIEDYPAHRSYQIYPNVSCTYTPLPGDFQKACIPADAKLVASFYMGVAEQTVDMQSWLIQTSDGNTQVLGVDTNHCAPLSVMAAGFDRSVGYMSTGGSSNMTLGIKDPSVFDPPEGCQPAAQNHAGVPSHLTKYLGALFP